MNKATILAFLTRLPGRTADILFPPDIYCIACGQPLDPGNLYSMCEDCLNEMVWGNRNLCRLCGKPLEDWYPDDLCGECKNHTRSFDRGVSCFQYQGSAREMIHDFKYHGKSYLSRIFSEIMYDKIRATGYNDVDLILPVPMYRKKEARRGYNQAALLAMFTGKRLNVEYRDDLLLRVRPTEPMNQLDPRQRHRNLDGAFAVTRAGYRVLPGKRVLLVDDIYTTGTTTEYCSRLLKQEGAVSVTILSLAAGRNQRILPDLPDGQDRRAHMRTDSCSGESAAASKFRDARMRTDSL